MKLINRSTLLPARTYTRSARARGRTRAGSRTPTFTKCSTHFALWKVGVQMVVDVVVVVIRKRRRRCRHRRCIVAVVDPLAGGI